MIDQETLERIAKAEIEMIGRRAIATTTAQLPEVLTALAAFTGLAAPRLPGIRGAAIVDAALEFKDESSLSLRLADDELVTVRPGATIVLVGGTGGGKTSLALSMSVEHAHNSGPAIVFSLELTADEAGARSLGLQADESWMGVLTGKREREHLLAYAPDRLVIIARREATLPNLRSWIDKLRAEYPGEPILVVIDYAQLMPSDEREKRLRVADAMAQIDDVAREKRITALALSQGSRASARALTSGERIGADSVDAGAEAAEIERYATVTLAIGAAGPESEDGTRPVEISIGKGRMTGGDRVVPARYCGRSGRWRLTGEARPAADVRAERIISAQTSKVSAARITVVACAERATEPQTREELMTAAALKGEIARKAINQAMDAGELVEVRRKRPRSQAWQIWTRTKADAAGIPVVTAAENIEAIVDMLPGAVSQ